MIPGVKTGDGGASCHTTEEWVSQGQLALLVCLSVLDLTEETTRWVAFVKRFGPSLCRGSENSLGRKQCYQFEMCLCLTTQLVCRSCGGHCAGWCAQWVLFDDPQKMHCSSSNGSEAVDFVITATVCCNSDSFLDSYLD